MLNPRLDLLTDYPFDRLRALLGDSTPPAGVEPLVLSIGEPQHAPPSLITEAMNGDLARWGKYPPINGTEGFRTAVTDWLGRRYGLKAGTLDADRHVLPVAGTREALYMLVDLAVAEKKNQNKPLVVIPNPFYQVYSGAALMGGADLRCLSATAENGYLPDLATLSEDDLARTAIIYLCSPANPQGAVADLDYLKNAISLARQYDFVLAVDECYAEIYDQLPPPGALEACQAMGGGFENVMIFHSLSKRSNAAGLRSGFVAGDPEYLARFRRLRSYAAPTLPLPILAASEALWRDEPHVAENRAMYQAKFDVAEEILGQSFGFFRPAGGFFLWLDVENGEAAAKRLWTEAGLRVLPGAYLARPDENGVNPGERYIRVALVHDVATTRTALHRLYDVLN